ncbi:MAG: low temperature requirement protein A [Lachnospiraceae bacterium]|nr:low temperature requirement protein A [Lachnospiraceae bacterium]
MFTNNVEEKKVEYLELIYDLIFVYLIGRNSSLIHHVENGFISMDLFITYILCTLVIIQIWNFTTLYINRYGSNGLAEHVCVFINMYLLYYMADGTRVHWQEYYYRYNVAWGLILVNLAVQHYLKMRQKSKEAPWEMAQIKNSMWILLTEAGIIFLSLPLYALTKLPFSPLGMVFGIVATALSGKVNQLVPVDFMHLTERAMLYVVFTFGEMIIGIASYFEGGFGFNTIYFSLMAFLIVTALFLSYGVIYDHLIDREQSTNATGYMLIHVFLILALNNITTALEFMREEEVDLVKKSAFLIGSFLLYYVCLFLTERYAKERMRLNKKYVTILVSLAVAFVALMGIFYRQMYVNIAITLVFALVVLGMLFRFWKTVVQKNDILTRVKDGENHE